MRSKNRSLLRGLLCLLISACLAGGCALLQLSEQAREDETRETTATAVRDTTMVTEAEDISPITTATAPLTEESETETTAEATYYADSVQKLWIAAVVLLVIGILSALLFVLLKPQTLPLLGPEGELLVLPVATFLFLQMRALEPLPARRCTVRMTNIASYEMDFSPTEITQRFVRGDKARSTKGSGLGLAIAQTYTESVGGSFHVEIDGDQFAAIVTIPKNGSNR